MDPPRILQRAGHRSRLRLDQSLFATWLKAQDTMSVVAGQKALVGLRLLFSVCSLVSWRITGYQPYWSLPTNMDSHLTSSLQALSPDSVWSTMGSPANSGPLMLGRVDAPVSSVRTSDGGQTPLTTASSSQVTVMSSVSPELLETPSPPEQFCPLQKANNWMHMQQQLHLSSLEAKLVAEQDKLHNRRERQSCVITNSKTSSRR